MKEHQQVEWKVAWRDEYLTWICAFANTEGGVLEIGRNDQGLVVGIADAERLLEEIPNKVRDILGILVGVKLKHAEDKEYLQIVTEAHPSPISYKGAYYIRSGSTRQELKGAALERFLLRKRGRHWDGLPMPSFKVKDLDPKALAYFREWALYSERLTKVDLGLSNSKLLEKLHLIENGFLKRAAILLFHPDPEVICTGAYLKIGFFEDGGEILYQDEIHGPLMLQIDQALDVLVLKYLRAMISYQGIQRVEKLPIPRPALREALLNAIIHKDYGSGAPIQVRVYDYKITVGNALILPEDWTLADLTREHESRPFNPDIANVFFRAGQIESWGRGIENIFRACTQAGLPEPLYSGTGSTLRLTFPFGSLESKSDGQAIDKRLTSDRQAIGTSHMPSLLDRETLILSMIAEKGKATTSEMAQRLNLSPARTRVILKEMADQGRITKMGQNRYAFYVLAKERDE